jgi:nitric oxide reductase subunit B
MLIQRLKWAAIISFIVCTAILIAGGLLTKDQLAPYPGKVIRADGKVLFEKKDIFEGQNVFQRYGLMDHGSVWGHGSQRGPEFSATSLHLAGEAVRNAIARQETGRDYAGLDPLQREIVDLKVSREIRTNRYDPANDILTLTPAQVEALDAIHKHWEETFRLGETHYGFLPNTVATPEERRQISRFFFWTAWVASTNRPGKDYSYTSN